MPGQARLEVEVSPQVSPSTATGALNDGLREATATARGAVAWLCRVEIAIRGATRHCLPSILTAAGWGSPPCMPPPPIR